jgi:peptidyl-prolyl isomerase E (cyclophilin E)
MDYTKGVHRGFAFTEYEDADDADEAIFNLNGSELLGRTLKVSLAQPNQVNKLSSNHEAVWKSDEWFKEYAGGTDEKTIQEQQDREKDARILHQD